MEASQWPANTPDSLFEQCIEFCATNLEQTVCDIADDGQYCLKPNLSFPSLVFDTLLTACSPLTRKHLGMLRDLSSVSVKHVNLTSIDDLTDEDLRLVIAHHPVELHFSSNLLTRQSLLQILTNGENLQALRIDNCAEFFEDADSIICSYRQLMDIVDGAVEDRLPKSTSNSILECPKLRRFSINGTGLESSISLLHLGFSGCPPLVQLDLTNTKINSVSDFSFALSRLNCLQILSLHNVPLTTDLQPMFTAISQVKTLRCLDLGQSSSNEPVRYDSVEVQLPLLMSNLTHLTWLEIAGTNLAGFVAEPVVSHRLTASTKSLDEPSCPIPGLKDRQLDYLGLLNCAHHACERENLPAKQVSGSANEQQIIRAIHAYIDRQSLLNASLNNLFTLFKHTECHDQRGALDGILAAMKQHLHDRSIQISGSASLFYIVKGSNKHMFSTKLKRTIIRTLIASLENHLNEVTTLRNCCLTLCHFRMPHDVMHTYEHLVSVLLKVIQSTRSPEDNFIQRIAIYLLNSLSCQVDYQEKRLVGQLGAFPVILELIRGRMRRKICDEVMEVAWSMLWNVTDETADNCKLFIDGDGMEIFIKCFKIFKAEHDELLRNMMGLLGNVAEVAFLRQSLMVQSYISIFRDLLKSSSDGIEVSYNACGVLAHIMSDGPGAWSVDSPSRAEVLMDMHGAISRWKLNSKRNINYRSFKPILRLIHCYETPGVQHFAIWALCNLTKMYRAKYCPLLEKEGGVEMLKEFCRDTRPYPFVEVKQLAAQVVDRCEHFEEDNNFVSEDEESE